MKDEFEFEEGWQELGSRLRWGRPDYSKCGKSLFSNFQSYQCSNKARYDPNAKGAMTRCGVHSKAAAEKRRERERVKAGEKRKAYEARKLKSLRASDYVKVIQAIADGHNDPRTLAKEYLKAKGLI